jgi:hypothetical protein
MNWVRGTVTTIAPKAVNTGSAILGTITGDNGTVYPLRDNSFAPEDRSHALRVGNRVRFEDRQGYIFDLRVMEART